MRATSWLCHPERSRRADAVLVCLLCNQLRQDDKGEVIPFQALIIKPMKHLLLALATLITLHLQAQNQKSRILHISFGSRGKRKFQLVVLSSSFIALLSIRFSLSTLLHFVLNQQSSQNGQDISGKTQETLATQV